MYNIIIVVGAEARAGERGVLLEETSMFSGWAWPCGPILDLRLNLLVIQYLAREECYENVSGWAPVCLAIVGSERYQRSASFVMGPGPDMNVSILFANFPWYSQFYLPFV